MARSIGLERGASGCIATAMAMLGHYRVAFVDSGQIKQSNDAREGLIGRVIRVRVGGDGSSIMAIITEAESSVPYLKRDMIQGIGSPKLGR